MTTTAWVLLTFTGLAAVANWISVGKASERGIYFSKPSTLALLTLTAVALTPRDPTQRWIFVIALLLSLVGDVFLMLPSNKFVQGLGAFLLAHVAYIVGLRFERTDVGPLVVSAAIVVAGMAIVGTRVIIGVRRTNERLVQPVAAYIAVIAVMGASALASGNPYMATGAVLFMVSDALIAWNRFIAPQPWGPLAIITTYHVGQTGLVLGLALS